jgi:hypothetical protein
VRDILALHSLAKSSESYKTGTEEPDSGRDGHWIEYCVHACACADIPTDAVICGERGLPILHYGTFKNSIDETASDVLDSARSEEGVGN